MNNETTPIIPIRNNQEATPLTDGADIFVHASDLPTKEEKAAEMASDAAIREAHAALRQVGGVQMPENVISIAEYTARIQSATLLVNTNREEKLAG